MTPWIPKDWSGYELTYRDRETDPSGHTLYEIRVENPGGVNRGVRQVTLDGEVLADADVPLRGGGRRHTVHVQMG